MTSRIEHFRVSDLHGFEDMDLIARARRDPSLVEHCQRSVEQLRREFPEADPLDWQCYRVLLGIHGGGQA